MKHKRGASPSEERAPAAKRSWCTDAVVACDESLTVWRRQPI